MHGAASWGSGLSITLIKVLVSLLNDIYSHLSSCSFMSAIHSQLYHPLGVMDRVQDVKLPDHWTLFLSRPEPQVS